MEKRGQTRVAAVFVSWRSTGSRDSTKNKPRTNQQVRVAFKSRREIPKHFKSSVVASGQAKGSTFHIAHVADSLDHDAFSKQANSHPSVKSTARMNPDDWRPTNAMILMPQLNKERTNLTSVGPVQRLPATDV